MIKKNIFLGLVFGIIANSIGFMLCVFIFGSLSNKVSSFSETISASLQNDTFGNLIILGAILNLFLFFFFLKKNQPYHARGVLLATIIAALCIAISKFI
ncbi:hypothetical protein [Aquimarina brevivitae]|uniref:Uncharacterized protein n=1 Tax=Aquimarina brevivitae TaxID=323412 RepID=A0A4Q7PEV0_9FLAO|nr:hypothetical protein [Aquimarina brevivitae]RZS98961.1 hypothetical protein EV197_0163 [Aquimarina brevivitae]